MIDHALREQGGVFDQVVREGLLGGGPRSLAVGWQGGMSAHPELVRADESAWQDFNLASQVLTSAYGLLSSY
jgi:hypothetical protein